MRLRGQHHILLLAGSFCASTTLLQHVSASQWYIVTSEGNHGPYSTGKLRELESGGFVRPDTPLIREEDGAGPMSLSSVLTAGDASSEEERRPMRGLPGRRREDDTSDEPLGSAGRNALQGVDMVEGGRFSESFHAVGRGFRNIFKGKPSQPPEYSDRYRGDRKGGPSPPPHSRQRRPPPQGQNSPDQRQAYSHVPSRHDQQQGASWVPEPPPEQYRQPSPGRNREQRDYDSSRYHREYSAPSAAGGEEPPPPPPWTQGPLSDGLPPSGQWTVYEQTPERPQPAEYPPPPPPPMYAAEGHERPTSSWNQPQNQDRGGYQGMDAERPGHRSGLGRIPTANAAYAPTRRADYADGWSDDEGGGMMNKVCSIFSLANLPLPLAREGGLLLIFSWATLSIVKGASTAGMAAVFSILVNSMSSLSGENRLQTCLDLGGLAAIILGVTAISEGVIESGLRPSSLVQSLKFNRMELAKYLLNTKNGEQDVAIAAFDDLARAPWTRTAHRMQMLEALAMFGGSALMAHLIWPGSWVYLVATALVLIVVKSFILHCARCSLEDSLSSVDGMGAAPMRRVLSDLGHLSSIELITSRNAPSLLRAKHRSALEEAWAFNILGLGASLIGSLSTWASIVLAFGCATHFVILESFYSRISFEQTVLGFSMILLAQQSLRKLSLEMSRAARLGPASKKMRLISQVAKIRRHHLSEW